MLVQHSVLTSVELATQELPVYVGVSSASPKLRAYQVFPGPCGSAVCPGFWEGSCTTVLHWLLPEPQAFHSFRVKFLGLGIPHWKTVYIWISRCSGWGFWFLTGNPFPPPLTTTLQSPGKTQSFLVTSMGWWGSYVQLSAAHWLRPYLLDPWRG